MCPKSIYFSSLAVRDEVKADSSCGMCNTSGILYTETSVTNSYSDPVDVVGKLQDVKRDKK